MAGQGELRSAVREALLDLTSDMQFSLDLVSRLRSAAFVLDNLPLHLGKTHGQLRSDAIADAPPEGLHVEFGVWKGFWINEFARTFRDRTFYGFDSFEGLPEPWSQQGAGHFSLGGRLPEVEPNVVLVKGWFEETLPSFLAEHPEPISFIHLDADLYASTMTALTFVRKRLQPGTQIVLDDFMWLPGWEREEHRAFMDFTAGFNISWEYTGWSTDSPACSAGVVITRV